MRADDSLGEAAPTAWVALVDPVWTWRLNANAKPAADSKITGKGTSPDHIATKLKLANSHMKRPCKARLPTRCTAWMTMATTAGLMLANSAAIQASWP